MDIAKIRKKIKEEKETGKTKEEGQADSALGGGGSQEESPETPAETRKVEGTVPDAEVGNIEDQDIQFSEPRQIETSRPETQRETVIKETETAEDSIVELLTFNLSTEEFAFRVSDIAEILRFQRITKVPRMPDYVMGITSLRGKIIPVTDLKKRLSLNPPLPPLRAMAFSKEGLNPPLPPFEKGGMGGFEKGEMVMTHREGLDIVETRKKILILKGDKGPFGAMIDKVKGVIRISPSDIAEPPVHLSVVESVFIEGVVLYNNRFISIIRITEVLNIGLK
jgi:chemotaxis signal transduction protein